MGRKNRRKQERIRKIHVNKYINQSRRKKIYSVGTTSEKTADSAAVVAVEMFAQPRPQPKRGDIWFADLGNHYGTSVQCGIRPVFIISNDTANRHANTLTVLPMTTKHKRPEYPTHIELPASYCEPDEYTTSRQKMEGSMILAEQITTIAKSKLRDRLGTVTDEEKLREIEQAVKVQMEMSI